MLREQKNSGESLKLMNDILMLPFPHIHRGVVFKKSSGDGVIFIYE